jgi:hypothetical protein
MARLFDFDYKTPFFYMVTVIRLPNLADFSEIAQDGRLIRNAITAAFELTIGSFHENGAASSRFRPSWSCQTTYTC